MQAAKIIKATANKDWTVIIDLDNNTKILLDIKDFLQYPVYKKLSNLAFFLCVKHDNSMIYWDDSCDFHIDQILDFGKTL